MRALAVAEMLALWERGAARHPLDRTAMLVAVACPELPRESIAELPLGMVTQSLVALRTACFGDRIACRVDCERCGERLEFSLDANDLLAPDAADDTPPAEIEVAGRRLRAPCLRDLAAIAGEPDAEQAVRILIASCTLDRRVHEPSGDAPNSDAPSGDALRDIEDRLEALDPNADLALALRCVACGHEGSAQLDVGALLWQEVELQAHALLREVDLLARVYGWTEEAILGLSPARRASYLALAA